MNLYKKIIDLKQDDLNQFSLSNMAFITRDFADLLIQRLKDNNKQKNFDNWLDFYLNVSENIQSIVFKNTTNKLTLDKSIAILHYLNNEFSSSSHIKTARYHLAMSIVEQFNSFKSNIENSSNSQKNVKCHDYFLTKNKIPDSDATLILNSINDKAEIKQHFNEQIACAFFAYHYDIFVNKEFLFKNDEQALDIIDAIVNCEQHNMPHNAGKINEFAQHYLIEPDNQLELIINEKIKKIDNAIQPQNKTYSHMYYELMRNAMKPLEYKKSLFIEFKEELSKINQSKLTDELDNQNNHNIIKSDRMKL